MPYAKFLITLMPIQWYILIGLVIAMAAILQSAVGFAFGLFSIPLLVWLGLPLPQAICLGLGVVLCQTVWGIYQYKEYIDISRTWPLAPARAVTVPLGVLTLGMVISLGQEHIKQMIGVVMLLAVLVQLFSHIQPRQSVPKGWGVVAGASSGFFTGLCGMGGPPVVLWVMAHDWSTKRIRTAIWLIFLQTMLIQLGMYAWRFGPKMLVYFAIGIALFPLAIVASALGLKLGSLMSRRRLRAAAFALLIIIALISIAQPLINMI